MAGNGKAVNVGPARGNNSFPLGNKGKGKANNSSRGGGGPAGDGTVLRDKAGLKAKGNGKGKPQTV